ncbi:MAG: glycosyltransferase family 2 protein, partial [Patescibacteria group bacterium]
VINHEYNRGYGAAIKTGVKEARHETICIIDADGTYPTEEIKTLISHVPEYDMAVGARSGKKVKMPLRRRFAKFFLILLIKILTGVKVPDMNSGLRVFKKSLIKRYMRLIPDGFSLTTTITICSIINNHKIKYVNINYHPRTGVSKIRPIKDTYNFFIVILKTVLYFKPLKVLLPVGIFLMAAAVALGVWSVFFLGRFLDTTTMVLFVSGLQIFILALLADLIVSKMH